MSGPPGPAQSDPGSAKPAQSDPGSAAAAPPDLPAALAVPAVSVGRRLEELLTAETARWTAVDPELGGPLEALRSVLLPGGKRVRAGFCHWAFVGAGGDPEDPALADAGAALEMLHAAALVHDDVIDRSDLRRGVGTLHVEQAARHRARGGRGDSERFGTAVAILVGDIALVYSGRLLAGAPPVARQVFEEARLEVNVGQYLDVVGSAVAPAVAGHDRLGPRRPGWPGTPQFGRPEARARARRTCLYKTAKYTVERPLHLGAAVAAPGRFQEMSGPLSSFGLPLGEAYQLRDDLLGAFGDPALTGKPVGDDLREGKPTLLAALAGSAATGRGALLFAERFGSADLVDAEVFELREVIESTGARAEVEARIAALTTASLEALEALPITPPARVALRELAAFVADRVR